MKLSYFESEPVNIVVKILDQREKKITRNENLFQIQILGHTNDSMMH